METSIEDINLYNPQSNKKYMEEERKNNLFVASTMDFFSFHVPLVLVFVFLLNRLFYCLFNFKVSSLLRPYCFWWIIFELLIQNNVEFFTFLAFRNCLTPYSFNTSTTLLQVLMIVMFFLVLLAAFGCYLWYYREYGKLARYFLVNMFRFPSSYGLMILLYGIRPFLKGAIHALMFYHWSTQMWMLFATDLLVLLILLVCEFACDNHRSKPVFMMDTTYSGCLTMLNILFLCKYNYFKGEVEL